MNLITWHSVKKILKLIEQKKYKEGANAFAVYFDIQLTLSTSSDKGNIQDNRGAKLIIEALRSCKPESIRWWAFVAEGWHKIGLSKLALLCLQKARAIIETDSSALPADVQKLSRIFSSIIAATESEPVGFKYTMTNQSFESLEEKKRRIALVFYQGQNDALLKEKIDNDLKANDLFGILMGFSSSYIKKMDRKSNLNPLLIVLKNLGEYQAAVEEFISVIAGMQVNKWLSEDLASLQTLLYFAQSLEAVGDPITAYACYLLLDMTKLDKAADPNVQSVLNQVQESRARLQWADQKLADLTGCYYSRERRIGELFMKYKLGGRYLNFIERQSRSASLRRQVSLMGYALGWFVPVIPLISENQPVRNASQHTLGLAESCPPRIKGSVLSGDTRDDTPGLAYRASYYPVPRPLSQSDVYAADPQVQITLGYSSEDNKAVSSRISKQYPLLALGSEFDDVYFLSLIQQMQAQGWKIVWIRNGKESLKPGLEQYCKDFIKIAPGNTVFKGAKEWFDNNLISEDAKQSLFDCFSLSVPHILDKQSGMAERLLKNFPTNWDAMTGTPSDLNKAAISAASRLQGLNFEQMVDFRQVALFMKLFVNFQEYLRSSFSMQVLKQSGSPAQSSDIHSGLILDISNLDSIRAGMISLLVVNSLLMTAAGSSPPDDFDLYLRPHVATSDKRRSKLELKEKFDESDGPDDLDDADDSNEIEEERARRDLNKSFEELLKTSSSRESSRSLNPNYKTSFWVRENLLSASADNKICVVLSGEYGAEWPVLIRHLCNTEMNGKFVFIAGSNNIQQEVVSRKIVDNFRQFLIGKMPSDMATLFGLSSRMFMKENGLSVTYLSSVSPILRKSIMIWPELKM